MSDAMDPIMFDDAPSDPRESGAETRSPNDCERCGGTGEIERERYAGSATMDTCPDCAPRSSGDVRAGSTGDTTDEFTTAAVAHGTQPSAPRSLGGAPNVLSPEKVAEVREWLRMATSDVDPAWGVEVCDSHEALRTQVSALRQPLTDEKLLGLIEEFRSACDSFGYFRGIGSHHLGEQTARRERAHDALESAVSALRQEAAQAVANARVRRKYIDAAAAARQEAETLRQEAAQQTFPSADLVKCLLYHFGTTDPELLEEAIESLNQETKESRAEAETLRGQLDEAQRHFRMYGQHDASCWLYRSGPCDCGFNEALAAARVAAPREPK